MNQPLVSVIIPTYNRAKTLMERAVPSVLAQSEADLELIVVGDRCTDETETIMRTVLDPRVRFANLPERGRYPAEDGLRWLVASCKPLNVGLSMARGRYITVLGDDDEFTPDHNRVLLEAAIARRYEFVYGVVRDLSQGGGYVGSWPPRCGSVCHLAVMYSSERFGHFRYDPYCWRIPEPLDWNLWRRIINNCDHAGFVDVMVGTHYDSGNIMYAAAGRKVKR